MPELPEVETVRSQLAQHVVGQTIDRLQINNASKLQGNLDLLLGHTIVSVRRFSKLLIIDTSIGYSLAIHLKMTGRLLLDVQEYLTNKHTHVIFTFTSGLRLMFNDYRRFGTLEVVPTDKVLSLGYIKKLGKEFFAGLTEELFFSILQTSSRAIKVVLLDQHKMAGVGNIYANEALWRAKLHPNTPAKTISKEDTQRLFKNLEAVMREGIERGGASSEDFFDLFGQKGTAQNYFDVYGKEGTPCPHCGALIEKYFLGGRGTYHCPNCQKLENL